MDDRSLAYIGRMMDGYGVIGVNCGWERMSRTLQAHDIEFSCEEVSSYWGKEYTIYAYKRCGQRRYAYEYVEVDVDDYIIVSIVVSRKLRYDELRAILLLIDIENGILSQRLLPTFRCYECGSEVHWLDIDARDIFERIKYWNEHYCGC